MDAIISLDVNIINLLSSINPDSINNVPIIFAVAANSINISNKNINGIYSPYNFDKFLENVLSLHPDTKNINFLINKNFKTTYFYDEIASYIVNKKKIVL